MRIIIPMRLVTIAIAHVYRYMWSCAFASLQRLHRFSLLHRACNVEQARLALLRQRRLQYYQPQQQQPQDEQQELQEAPPALAPVKAPPALAPKLGLPVKQLKRRQKK